MKYALLTLSLFAGTSLAESPLPAPIECYQSSTQAKDINAYMACFTDSAVMIDVSRKISGGKDIRRWAQNEVIPFGDSFAHRRILESNDFYAKTEVKWSSWVAHYHYWWNEEGKITRMSLQYANQEDRHL